jgi:sulfatase maturation enzyme AslB (radical SAM superfamily)
MSLKQYFCPSPWFHMRINNVGEYEYCRWLERDSRPAPVNIRNIDPLDYFKNEMAEIRTAMTSGRATAGCSDCYKMEKYGKISGRQKQLLKTGVRLEYFDKSLLSSPWFDTFLDPSADIGVQDWQIDLGNYCNSACLFCHPLYSSRLAAEWHRLKIIEKIPKVSWCEDPVLLDKFIQALKSSPKTKYIHFIGGETIITPAFKVILRILVEQGIAAHITIGFTTGLTVWDEEVVDLLTKFGGVNLGMSIECFDPANDYIRWPSEIGAVQKTLERWIRIGQQNKWLLQLRVTPNVLSILHLHTVYDYAYRYNIAIESCNFISHPEYMKPAVLPVELREQVIEQLKTWLQGHQITVTEQIVNHRNSNYSRQQILQDAASYIAYLEQEPDLSHLLPDLVDYLKLMESSRKNSVLDYLPEYENAFRSAGY